METIAEILKSKKPAGFAPRPFYSSEGDSLTFFFEDQPYYGERIDDFLTAYRAMDGDGLVGCQVKGLLRALRLLGDFGLIVSDGNVSLTMIFMVIALMAENERPEATARYKELGRLAAERNVSIPANELPRMAA